MSKKNQSDFIDIKGIIREYLSKWYLFVISIVLCLCLAFVYTKIKRPVYAVRANLLIANQDSSPMSALGSLGDLIGSKGQVDDEIFVISSHSLYRDVARELGLSTTYRIRDGFLRNHMAYPDYPLAIVPEAGLLDTLTRIVTMKAKVNEKGLVSAKLKVKRRVIGEIKNATLPANIETSYGTFTLQKTPTFPEGEKFTELASVMNYDVAAEILAQDVTCDIASKHGNVISLAIDTDNPEFGQDVLNRIIKQYNERGIDERNDQGEQTAAFLDERIALLSADLTDVEMALQKYKETKGIVDVSSEASYQTAKRARLEEGIVLIETQNEIMQLTIDFLSNPENAYDLIPTSLEAASGQNVISEYNSLVLERLNMISGSNENNQAVQRITERLTVMRKNLLSSVESALESNKVRLRDMQLRQRSVLDKLSAVPTQEREALDMRRQQQVKQQLYVYLLQRREETAMLLSTSVPKGQVVDRAFTMSKPLGMSRKMIFILAFFFALCLPPCYLALRKFLRNKFETREELEKLIDAPILGEMATDNSGRQLVIDDKNNSSSAELFRLMRTNLLFIINGTSHKVVNITSSTSGEGKSFISINLAASLSLLHKRVLLVGMDIRNPQLAHYLNLPTNPGLTQYLSSDNISLDSIIRHMPGYANFDVIVAGPVPPNPSELLASPRLDEMIAQLREHYDYILLDTAPVGMVSDTFSLDRLSDATIFVTRANFTTLENVRALDEIYANNRLKRLSVVVNGTASKKSYGYGRPVGSEG